MLLASSIQYRDPESERVVIEILGDSRAQDAFLKDREGYLARFNLRGNTKSLLLCMPAEQLISAANQCYQNSLGIDGYGHTCASTSFADLYCDQ